MSLVTRFFEIIRQNRRLYVLLNLVYYGIIFGGMIWVSSNPSLEQALRTAVKANFNSDLIQAYAQGAVLPAIFLTFYNNFVLASLLAITLPSLVIPFWGLLVGAVRAALWGLA